jgi:hypothetical protein
MPTVEQTQKELEDDEDTTNYRFIELEPQQTDESAPVTPG